MARALTPTYFRLGGTTADVMNYDLRGANHDSTDLHSIPHFNMTGQSLQSDSMLIRPYIKDKYSGRLWQSTLNYCCLLHDRFSGALGDYVSHTVHYVCLLRFCRVLCFKQVFKLLGLQ